jgi:hypothetical protein
MSNSAFDKIVFKLINYLSGKHDKIGSNVPSNILTNSFILENINELSAVVYSSKEFDTDISTMICKYNDKKKKFISDGYVLFKEIAIEMKKDAPTVCPNKTKKEITVSTIFSGLRPSYNNDADYTRTPSALAMTNFWS